MRYKILGNRVKLIDSYLIRKADFYPELCKIRTLHPTCRLWKRSEMNIMREWAAHNLAHSLGINREKTESVDLDYEPKWYLNIFYWVVGTIALWVIK